MGNWGHQLVRNHEREKRGASALFWLKSGIILASKLFEKTGWMNSGILGVCDSLHSHAFVIIMRMHVPFVVFKTTQTFHRFQGCLTSTK